MAMIDSWTDDTTDRALLMLRLGEAIVRQYRKPVTAQGALGIRPSTIDRWLMDVAEFVRIHLQERQDAEAETDGQGEEGDVAHRRSLAVAVRR